MDLSPDLKTPIAEYLLEISLNLDDMAPAERRELLQNVEAHIYEALHEHASATPSRHDLEAVLAEMPLPSSYSSAEREAGDTPMVKSSSMVPVIRWSTVNWEAGVGAVLVFLSIWWFIRSKTLFTAAPIVGNIINAEATGYLIIGILAAVLSIIFGWLGIKKYRTAATSTASLALAMFANLFYPLCCLLAFLPFVFSMVPFRIPKLGWLVLCSLITLAEICIVRDLWRKYHGKLAGNHL